MQVISNIYQFKIKRLIVQNTLHVPCYVDEPHPLRSGTFICHTLLLDVFFHKTGKSCFITLSCEIALIYWHYKRMNWDSSVFYAAKYVAMNRA
jgi:hypothetical protein